MDPRQRHLGQSQHIAHNPEAEDQVLAAMAAQADHKPLGEEAMASGYGPYVSEHTSLDLRERGFHLLALGTIGTARTVSRQVQLTRDSSNVFTRT